MTLPADTTPAELRNLHSWALDAADAAEREGRFSVMRAHLGFVKKLQDLCMDAEADERDGEEEATMFDDWRLMEGVL